MITPLPNLFSCLIQNDISGEQVKYDYQEHNRESSLKKKIL